MKAKKQAFSRLTAAQKRVAIAKDILKQIAADLYYIEQGTWLNIDGVDTPEDTSTQSQIVQAALLGGKRTVVIESKPASCTCCAVGAACASAIRLFNQDSLSGNLEDGFELPGYDEGSAILSKYFPLAQVDLMEAAFEQRTDSHHADASDAALQRAVEFGDEYDNDTERLKAICKNIIKNQGDFKP